MNTLGEIRAKCVIDPATRCWLWQGSCCEKGQPRVYTIDYARKTKRTMSGPTAVWNIAHEEAPLPGHRVYRFCTASRLCLNPAHLRMARTHGEMMQCIAPRMRGTHIEQRRAAAAKGREVQGIRSTPDDVVRQILLARGTNVSVAARFGVNHGVVSRIRRGESHKHIERPA